MADVHETDLLGKVFFETSPNTGTVTWTNHTAKVSRMSLTRGGASVAVGISNVEVGTAVISLVDLASTILVGYWVRVRTLSGNVWAGYVQDISTSFEIVNGVTYQIKSLYCVDWVGYAGQVLLENAIGLNTAGGTAITTMPYTSDKRINALNNAFDPTGAAVLISQDGASTALVGHSNQTNSLAGHLDLLANTVGGYWNSTTATPTNATTGRDGLLLFSKRTDPVYTGIAFAEVGGIPYQNATVGESTSSVSNSVIIRNTGQLAVTSSEVAYDEKLFYSHEYGAELGTSIDSYGARQLTVETNFGLALRTGFVNATTQARNRCRNPNFEQNIDGWIGSTLGKISLREPSTQTVPWAAYTGKKVLRLRATASATAISAEYAPADTNGVPVVAGEFYGIVGWIAKETGASNSQVQVRVDWLDDDETVLSTSTGAFFALTVDKVWVRVTARLQAPANAVTANFRFYFNRVSGSIGTAAKYCVDSATFYRSGSASDIYENPGEPVADNNYISFSLGSVGASESVTVTNSLYSRALAIAVDNELPRLCVQTLTWNAQTDLTKVHLLDLNKSVDIVTPVIGTRQKIVGIRHEITKDRWITQLELEAKRIIIPI